MKLNLASIYQRRKDSINLAASILLALGPQADEPLSLFLQGRDLELANLEFIVDEQLSIDDFRDRYLAYSLLSKYPFKVSGLDRASVALTKFKEAEEKCAETNIRLSNLTSLPCESIALIEAMKRKIRWILGPFSWDHAEHFMGFGPGATTRLPRSKGDAYYKMQGKLHTTNDNLIPAMIAVYRVPRWWELLTGLNPAGAMDASAFAESVQVVVGSKVTTVPKNAKTDRTICIEPDLNMFVQKGIGGLIRTRLKRTGCDLNDQSRNQQLAARGSMTGNLATIDLKAASDSVSLKLVELLLPDDWLLPIKLSRSWKCVLPDGSEHLLRKVSSMGNGFTFELESLIFWALVLSIVPADQYHQCAVYGDDIVIPAQYSHVLIRELNILGFEVNPDKSFWVGSFRESCGMHYYRGVDVTPFYIREDVEPTMRRIWLANQVRRWSRMHWGLDGRMEEPYRDIVATLPGPLRKPRIPDGFGDGALIGDLDEVRPQRAPVRPLTGSPENMRKLAYLGVGWDAWRTTHVVTRCRTFDPVDDPYLLRRLYALDRKGDRVAEEEGSGIPVLRRRPEYGISNLIAPTWPSHGPWLHCQGSISS